MVSVMTRMHSSSTPMNRLTPMETALLTDGTTSPKILHVHRLKKMNPGNGLLYAIITVLLLALIGGGGYVFTRNPKEDLSPFAQALDNDSVTEQQMASEKSLPSIEDATGPQQWEENGVHWSRDEQGILSYFDTATNAWVPYQK